MRPMYRTVLLLTLLTLISGAATSWAEQEGKRWSAELFLGLPDTDPFDQQGEDAVGLRIHAPLAKHWSIEASWSHHEPDSDFFDHTGDYVDLSLRYDITRNDRLTFFAFAGPGWYSLDRPKGIVYFGGIVDPGPEPEGASFHAGIGLDIHLGEHFYLRPDLRHRVLEEASFFDENFNEGTVALGYRF